MSREHHFLKLICKAALAAGAVYLVNETVDRFATNKKLLTYHAGNMFTWRGVKIYYTRQGSGSPVILLHDLHPAASSAEWNSITEALAVHHTVYTVDLPGLGRSDKRNQPYTNFYYVEFLREFIAEMELSDVAVIASNASAPVALMAAVYDSKLLDKLILICPPTAESLSVAPDGMSKLKKAVLELPLIGTFIYNILYARTQIDFEFTERYLYNPFHENNELVDTCYESAHLGHGQGRYFAAARIGNYLNINIGHALAKLSVPTLILEGNNLGQAGQVIREWTGKNDLIHAVRIDHAKALPHFEEPDAVMAEIDRFLD